jgi:hypothetical protein
MPMSCRSWPGCSDDDDDDDDCSSSLRSQSPEDRRQVSNAYDMASDLSWSDLASDIVSESGASSSHQLVALHRLVQSRLVSEPALRARVVAKLCADGEAMQVLQTAEDAEDAALVLLVDIAFGLPCWRVATIRIQSAARGCAARRKLRNRILAVCALQRGARACARRRRVARAQRAATALQGFWRARSAQHAWLRIQRAARLLQATERLRRQRPLVRVMRRRAMAGAAQLAGARAESAALRVELATSHSAHGLSTGGAGRLGGALLLLLLAAAGGAGVGALGRIATLSPVVRVGFKVDVTKAAVESAVEAAVATATAAVGSAAAVAAAAAATEAAAAGLALAAAQQATAEARAGWAAARGEAEVLRTKLALQTRSARGTAVVRGRSRMVGRGQALRQGEDGADEEGAEEGAEGGADGGTEGGGEGGAGGANGAKGANARQEEEEASQSAHAVASKHGAARWLVRLTRHAASFWVQLAVARLEVLLAYGCGDDGPETGDAGGGGGVVAPMCRQMRRWNAGLSARLSKMSGGKRGDEMPAGEGGGEANQGWPQKASECDDNTSHAEKLGTAPHEVSAEEAVGDRPAATLFNFLLGSS